MKELIVMLLIALIGGGLDAWNKHKKKQESPRDTSGKSRREADGTSEEDPVVVAEIRLDSEAGGRSLVQKPDSESDGNQESVAASDPVFWKYKPLVPANGISREMLSEVGSQKSSMLSGSANSVELSSDSETEESVPDGVSAFSLRDAIIHQVIIERKYH